MKTSRLVLHVPHSSRYIPTSVRSTLLLSDADLQQELLQITDAFTDELFQCALPGAVTVRYPVSRLVVDPERFEDDSEEPMTRVGMGVIYTNTIDGNPLRRPPSPKDREALLTTYYRPHHQALTEAVSAVLLERAQCLIIDCHSFPARPLPYELDQNPDRPDICIEPTNSTVHPS